MPDPAQAKAATKALFGRVASAYDTVIPFFTGFGKELVDAAAVAPGERVLDVACGRGACLRPAAAAVGPNGFVLGIDLCEVMVERVRSDLLADHVGNADAHVMDAEELHFPDGSFDVVLCGFGVFFFPEVDHALAGIHRVLGPGGRFAASTFTTGFGMYPWVRELGQRYASAPPAAPSPAALADGLRERLLAHGFELGPAHTVTRQFVFRDVDMFLAWVRTHGGRALIEHLDESQLPTFRAECEEHLADHAVDSGYEFTQSVDLTTATRV